MAKQTVNVMPVPKLSRQQKSILTILEEYDGEASQRDITRQIAERTGQVKRLSKQEYLDHALTTLRETEEAGARRLLGILFTDIHNKMPRKGWHHVTDSGRASICRSIRRLEERGLVRRDLFGRVFLASMFPDKFDEEARREVNVRLEIRGEIEDRNG